MLNKSTVSLSLSPQGHRHTHFPSHIEAKESTEQTKRVRRAPEEPRFEASSLSHFLVLRHASLLQTGRSEGRLTTSKGHFSFINSIYCKTSVSGFKATEGENEARGQEESERECRRASWGFRWKTSKPSSLSPKSHSDLSPPLFFCLSSIHQADRPLVAQRVTFTLSYSRSTISSSHRYFILLSNYKTFPPRLNSSL